MTAVSLLDNGSPVDVCWFTENTYTNPNPTGYAQDLGRSVLGARDAVVLMPRNPLTLGHTYTVSLTVNGSTTTWSFTTTSAPSRAPAVPHGADTRMGEPNRP